LGNALCNRAMKRRCAQLISRWTRTNNTFQLSVSHCHISVPPNHANLLCPSVCCMSSWSRWYRVIVSNQRRSCVGNPLPILFISRHGKASRKRKVIEYRFHQLVVAENRVNERHTLRKVSHARVRRYSREQLKPVYQSQHASSVPDHWARVICACVYTARHTCVKAWLDYFPFSYWVSII
jgi:hypothetical protein